MSDDIQSFLGTSPVFRDVSPEQMAEIAPLFRRERHPSGTTILHQGGTSPGIYFLKSGQLAVRIQRGDVRETVAYLNPPDFFGELSFLTGRVCVADVEVVVDAEVLLLDAESVPKLPQHREALLRGLMRAIAERLHKTVTQGLKVVEWPVVLLWNHPHWEAPWSFATYFASSLARQTRRRTLLMTMGDVRRERPRLLEHGAKVSDMRTSGTSENLRSVVAGKLTDWKASFENVILNPVGPDAAAIAEKIKEFANYHGHLIGPGDMIPPTDASCARFTVESAVQPTLPLLNGSQQLVFDASESESAHRSRQPVTPRFQRTVDSIARCVAGIQVGLALGGGAAWGWAHVGVLEVLEEAGLPLDAISGCSMGSVIGSLRCSGRTVPDLREIADYWRTRTRRFVEWRLWRMCLLNERMVRKTFRQYFGDRAVNQTEIPFWANAVDIKAGKEFTIQTGSLVDCVRASIALPGLLPPLSLNSHMLVDAGIMNPVPANLVRQMGCHYTIAVNAMAALEKQKMHHTRYPFNAFEIMTRCMLVTGHEIGEARAEQVANLVFTPHLGDISMLQFGRSPEIIECGRKAAQERLPAILAGYERLKERPNAPQAEVPPPQI